MNPDEKIRFAFYKPQKGDWFGSLVSWWTGLFNWKTPPYTHVEIGFLSENKWKYYSSASKNTNGHTGTRWLDESVVLEHFERWDIYDVLPIRNMPDMIKSCADELGKEYDWLGIWGFVTIFGQINSKSRWYCSEICHYIFFGRWKKRVSPKYLFRKITPNIVKTY